VGAVVLGLAGMLYAVFLAGASVRERREALPVFRLALGAGTVAVLGLPLAVNYLGFQAGEIMLLSGKVHPWGR
jgi:hypothetical protein